MEMTCECLCPGLVKSIMGYKTYSIDSAMFHEIFRYCVSMFRRHRQYRHIIRNRYMSNYARVVYLIVLLWIFSVGSRTKQLESACLPVCLSAALCTDSLLLSSLGNFHESQANEAACH